MAKKQGETGKTGKPQTPKEPKRMGRPPIENPMRHTVSCRVTDGDLLKLKRYADDHGLTIAETLQKGLASLIADL